MSATTVESAMEVAQGRAAEIAAEKFFYDKNTPFFPCGFSISRRNPGHWDIFARPVPGAASAWLASHPGGQTSAKDTDRERAFRIRGEPGDVMVMDERWNPHHPHPREPVKFRSVLAAMVWICEELMQEPKP